MTPRPFTVLLVSPDRLRLRRLTRFLDVFGYDVRQATSGQQAQTAAAAAHPDFLIVDATQSPPEGALCQAVRRLWPGRATYCLLLLEHPEVGDITSALEAGFDDFLASPLAFGELLARLRAGARWLAYETRLAEQGGIDARTGLANRAALARALTRRGEGAIGAIGWLALFDLDYFQRAIDQVGRCAAEELVRQAGKVLLEAAGGMATLVAAWGDDQFAVLLPASDEARAALWCQEALASLAKLTVAGPSASWTLTASCGLTEVAAGEVLEVVGVRVYRALQLAKASGRDCVVSSGEVDREAEAWAALAAEGQLFQTTLARDVMQPCPLLLSADETIDLAYGLMVQTGLAHVPVVDAEGRLAGVVSRDQLASARLRGKGRAAGTVHSSLRLVRQVMLTEVPRFEETTPLAELLEFFTDETATLAVIVHDKRPRGLVHCHALAALNERLTADHFAAAQPPSGTSADLLVPDLAMAD
jgi:GGDEF domain-containing protein/CBS domain-containing protein